MATRMQQRRGTAAQWVLANDGMGPILNAGEIGFETDTLKFKIGDGINHWVDLDYYLSESALGTSLTDYLSTDLLGAANGVAQLNSSGKLVSEQIPNIDEITQDAIDAALVAGTGLDKTYNDGANTITLDIDSTVATKTYADSAVSTHSSDTTDVHGITDTAELATKAFAASLLTGATKSNITITGDKNGLTITAENGVADSTTDNLTEGSTNKYFTDERAQDAVGNSVGTGLTYTDATGEIKVDTTTIQARVSGVSDTEIGYLDGVTSAIQTQLDSKAPTSSPTFTGTVNAAALTLSGNLTVNGTTTTINSTTLAVDDKNVVLGDVDSPTDVTANAGGITLKGDTDKTLNWLSATGSWTSSENINISAGKTLKIGGTDVVSSSALGTGVTGSSLTSVGTITSGTWNGSTIAVANGGTGTTTSTGTGSVVLSSSPTLVTPALGTPASATLTNATGLPISTGVSGLGTGVATALGTNVGSSGAPVVNGGALGTPSSGTLTNATGLPVSTGISGLGTGVATALAVNVGSAGAPVVNGGALGTPSSGTLTSATGLPLTTGVTGTLPVANGGTGVTTSTGSGNTVLSTSPTLVTPVLGTPTSVTLTNATGLPLTTGVTGTLPIANGGTGATTAMTAATALLPSQTSNSGKYLTNDGAGTLSWGTVSGYSAPTIGTTSITSGGTFTTLPGVTSINGATVPSSGTLATLTGTETFTNKTLTAPIITNSINAQTGTTYTTVLSDAAALVTLTNASAITVSIPTNANVAYPVGSQINFAQLGAGQVTINAVTSGTTTILSTGATSTAPKLRTTNSVATAVKISTDQWLITGDIS